MILDYGTTKVNRKWSSWWKMVGHWAGRLTLAGLLNGNLMTNFEPRTVLLLLVVVTGRLVDLKLFLTFELEVAGLADKFKDF